MNCMKCGRELKGEQAFCRQCLEEMEQYPVRPDIVVQIPRQPKTHYFRHRKPALTHDEHLQRLKRRIFRLRIAVVAASLVALIFAVVSVIAIYELDVHKIWGRNYTVAEDAGP